MGIVFFFLVSFMILRIILYFKIFISMHSFCFFWVPFFPPCFLFLILEDFLKYLWAFGYLFIGKHQFLKKPDWRTGLCVRGWMNSCTSWWGPLIVIFHCERPVSGCKEQGRACTVSGSVHRNLLLFSFLQVPNFQQDTFPVSVIQGPSLVFLVVRWYVWHRPNSSQLCKGANLLGLGTADSGG